MHDVDPKHRPLAPPSGGDQASPPLGSDPGGRGGEHGIRGGTGAGGDHPRDTRPDRTTRWVDTSRGLLSYQQLAPLLADRVALAEADLFRGHFSALPLDEDLFLELHARLCGDLVPEWAGRWRVVAVTVGRLQPPLPHLIALEMRTYAADLAARWPEASVTLSELTLEFLAFAEGRFLTVHPFRDFNGRTIRLFLLELLRRLDLPRVVLAPQAEPDRAAYFAALEAADRRDWLPLIEIWRERFARADTSP
jgi:CRISPR-associated endonuclease/helicase Cas3